MKLIRLMMGLACLFIAAAGYAKPSKPTHPAHSGHPTHVELVLNELHYLVRNEKGSDEIYLSVTATYSDGKFKSYTIPGGRPPVLDSAEAGFPVGPPETPQLYWLTKGMDNVKDVSLWSDDLQAGQAVQLAVSVIEHDMPPWNLDDMIGTVKINVGNKDGKVSADWVLISPQPKQASGKLPMHKKDGFDIDGNKGSYHITVTLK